VVSVLAGSAERVASFLRARGLDAEIREFDTSTRNSLLAAQALGCSVAEIAKSVVFSGGGTLVVIVSGDRKVDTGKLAGITGSVVELATPEAVRENTGYPIGGVPPFPHNEGVRVIPDLSLTRFQSVWAAGGVPNVVFKMATDTMLRVLGVDPVDVSAQSAVKR
jgi:prolyl-tRNA editing enzyme YbaK/EbsC (Cys-tRNA(Pro) deacylase)